MYVFTSALSADQRRSGAFETFSAGTSCEVVTAGGTGDGGLIWVCFYASGRAAADHLQRRRRFVPPHREQEEAAQTR